MDRDFEERGKCHEYQLGHSGVRSVISVRHPFSSYQENNITHFLYISTRNNKHRYETNMFDAKLELRRSEYVSSSIQRFRGVLMPPRKKKKKKIRMHRNGSNPQLDTSS